MSRPQDVLEGAVLARCPSCRNTFSTDRSGRQDCPVCGKPLMVPEAAPPLVGNREEVRPPPPPVQQGTPWERRGELGFGTAWGQTVQQALFEPSRLFSSVRLDQGRAQLTFVLTLSVFWIIGQLLQIAIPSRPDQLLPLFERFMSAEQMAAVRQMIARNAALSSPGVVLLLAALSPLFVFLFLYLNAGVTHLLALLFGQSKRGFPATFAACAYGSTPMILLAIPGCGGIIALVWTVVLIGIGMKETHGISAAGATATVLAPYAVFCCICCGSAAAFAVVVGRAMGRH